MLSLPNPDARALIAGESIAAFLPRHSANEGDEFELIGSGPRPDAELKPAYRRWNEEPLPDGRWVGVIESLVPTAVLDPVAGLSRHVLTITPSGDLALVRVYGPSGPVLSDAAFEARRTSIEGDLHP